jgi:hypothetical protein
LHAPHSGRDQVGDVVVAMVRAAVGDLDEHVTVPVGEVGELVRAVVQGSRVSIIDVLGRSEVIVSRVSRPGIADRLQ